MEGHKGHLTFDLCIRACNISSSVVKFNLAENQTGNGIFTFERPPSDRRRRREVCGALVQTEVHGPQAEVGGLMLREESAGDCFVGLENDEFLILTSLVKSLIT